MERDSTQKGSLYVDLEVQGKSQMSLLDQWQHQHLRPDMNFECGVFQSKMMLGDLPKLTLKSQVMSAPSENLTAR